MTVRITIDIHFEEKPSEAEQQILNAIGNARQVGALIKESVDNAHKETAPVETKPPAKKAAAAPKAETKPKAEPTPAPDPAPVEEEPTVEEAPAATLKDATNLATKLIQAGKSADLKAFLTDVGAKRVSDLKPDQIGKLLAEFADA